MRIRVQVLIASDQEAPPLRVEEVACFERDHLSPETLGLRLEEAKQMLASVQHVITESQMEEYVEQQRQCPHCQQPLTCKGHHQIGVRTLFGKLTLSSPRLYTCSCQPHQKHSWSPVAAPLNCSVRKSGGPRFCRMSSPSRGHHIIDTTGESSYEIDGREEYLLS